MTDEELKKAVESYHKAEVAYLNKVFEGICTFEFQFVKNNNDDVVGDVMLHYYE